MVRSLLHTNLINKYQEVKGMQVGFVNVRNVDFKDKHYYLIEVQTKQSKILTLGKFYEQELCFEYYNYIEERMSKIDIFETRKLIGVYSIESALRDLDYYRALSNRH